MHVMIYISTSRSIDKIYCLCYYVNMATQATQTTHQTKSLLDKFHLDYELDKTWRDAKRDVKLRTTNKH